MTTKQALFDYSDTLEAIEEYQRKIDKLDVEIHRTEKRIHDIEENETVKDKVYGGEGGWQGFVIEGIPIPEYRDLKQELQFKQTFQQQLRTTLVLTQYDLISKKNHAEKFIRSIKDDYMKRIISLRFIERKKWNQVADDMHGTEDSVRKAYQRFMQNH